MVFFRIKKIKGNEYAYAVENEWKAGSSRQKVRGYLGKVYRLDPSQDIDFMQFVKADIKSYIYGNDNSKIINDLVEWELFRFKVDKSMFSIDLSNKRVKKGKKDVVLLINEGFLCNLTLRNLLEFKLMDEQNDVYRLARAFVEAGIKVPQEVFINLFEKVYKSAEKPKSDFTW